MTAPMSEPMSEELVEIRGLRGDFSRLTGVILEERLGRRSSARLARIAVAALLVVASAWGYDAHHRAQLTCAQRTESRTEIRAAIRAGVDEVAAYANLDQADRDAITERVAHRVRKELPAPDC